MSISFFIRGIRRSDEELLDNNYSNVNACDALRALELPAEPYGEIRGRALRQICAAYIDAPILDAGIEPSTEGRLVHCGRRPGRIFEIIVDLYALAKRAGDLGLIIWA